MGYITAAEYLYRFGERETIIITNEQPNSTSYDSTKLGEAIDDGTADAEGYIGTRYVVPLVDVPRIVKGWVANLAREKLYIRNPPQVVKDNADATRAALKDVASGKITLPVAENQAPPTSNASGSALTSGDAPYPTFTTTKQAEYMAPFLGGYPGACWRNGG